MKSYKASGSTRATIGEKGQNCKRLAPAATTHSKIEGLRMACSWIWRILRMRQKSSFVMAPAINKQGPIVCDAREVATTTEIPGTAHAASHQACEQNLEN